MNDNRFCQAPVAIGGVGGSGTRIVAQFLIDLGFYMGADLNVANDNRWFTLLFKRPHWFVNQHALADAKVFSALRIFEKAMTGSAGFKPVEVLFITRAALQIAFTGHDQIGSGSGSWALGRLMTLLRSRHNRLPGPMGWGWKEPNSHIFLSQLNDHFRNLRYIHVIRHGLDMALSRNQAQLFNWGVLFGIPKPPAWKFVPKAALSYWIKSNGAAIDCARRLLGDRFLLVNFDELCAAPETGVGQIVKFLHIDPRQVDVKKLASLPRTPSSSGRYRKRDLGIFTEGELSAVRKLGFAIEG